MSLDEKEAIPSFFPKNISIGITYGSVNMKIKCKECGKEFEKAYFNQLYCSRQCKSDFNNKKNRDKMKAMNKYPSGFGTTNCAMCGKEFEKTTAMSKYCSTSCRGRYHRELSKIKKEQESIKNNIYTSDIEDLVHELISTGIEGRNNTISFNYKHHMINETLRHNISHRDNYSCRVCNADTNLEIHHIVKVIHGGDNSSSNLITLCKSCHRAIDTLDFEHASKKCVNNFMKNYNNKRYTNKSNEVMLNNCYSLILNLYNEAKDYDIDRNDLIKSLDLILDTIENNKAD